MNKIKSHYDVIIIGGSFSGLSAALSLGRMQRSVLVIDNNKPSNINVAKAHNFLTRDGESPKEILSVARAQLKKYPTIHLHTGKVKNVEKNSEGFETTTDLEECFISKKIIIASGVKYILPPTKGFSECWGISIFNCPNCHAYEFANKRTGIIGNGNLGFGLAKIISQYSKYVTIYTEGPHEFSKKQFISLKNNKVDVVENEIESYLNTNGKLNYIQLKDGAKIACEVIYSMPQFEQHSNLAKKLGCKITDEGLISIDRLQRTTISGVFACGDCSSWARSIAVALANGNIAGVSTQNELFGEDFF